MALWMPKGEQPGRQGEGGSTRLHIKYRNIIKVKQLIFEKKKRYALEAAAKAPNVAQFSMLPHATPQTPNYYQPAEPADEGTGGQTTPLAA